MDNKHKIYGLLDPYTNELRYVGQTISCLKQRLRAHISEKKNYRKTSWIKSLKSISKRPIIFLIDECSTLEECNTLEIFWIGYFKSIGCKLTNMYEGGRSYKKTQEQKDNISLGMKRVWANGKTIHPNVIDLLKKLGKERIGKKRDANIVEKIAKSNKGKKRTPEQCKRIGNGQIGSIHTEEHKLKISIGLKKHCKNYDQYSHIRNWKEKQLNNKSLDIN